jgi:hypothetical protein
MFRLAALGVDSGLCFLGKIPNARKPSPKAVCLGLFLRFFHRQFGALETDLAVSSIAERLVDRSTAAAKGERGLSREIEWGAVDVD